MRPEKIKLIFIVLLQSVFGIHYAAPNRQGKLNESHYDKTPKTDFGFDYCRIYFCIAPFADQVKPNYQLSKKYQKVYSKYNSKSQKLTTFEKVIARRFFAILFIIAVYYKA